MSTCGKKIPRQSTEFEKYCLPFKKKTTGD